MNRLLRYSHEIFKTSSRAGGSRKEKKTKIKKTMKTTSLVQVRVPSTKTKKRMEMKQMLRMKRKTK